VAGIDAVREPARLRERIGLAGQYASVDESLTGAENLVMVGRLYGMKRNEAKPRAAELLERFSLLRRRRPRGQEVLGRHAPAARPGGGLGGQAARAVP